MAGETQLSGTLDSGVFEFSNPDHKPPQPKQNLHTTSSIVMVEPALFRHNFKTAADNSYQEKPDNMSKEEVDSLAKLTRQEAFAKHPGLQERTETLDRDTHEKGSLEFSGMVSLLRSNLIQVVVIPDVPTHDTPDSIFPNNPLSFHLENGGSAVKYPMRHENRRPEKLLPITETLRDDFGHQVSRIIDLSSLENEGHYVEGTGSMVLDRNSKIAYASISERTTSEGVATFADKMDYKAITFRSFDRIHGTDVYHANVVMSVGSKFAVICLEAITDATERKTVLDSLQATGKDVITISTEQMNGFAGNILEVQTTDENPAIVMSETAYRTFNQGQLEKLSQYGEIVHAPIPTIEKHGGGSARCMMLEVHLPKQELH